MQTSLLPGIFFCLAATASAQNAELTPNSENGVQATTNATTAPIATP